MELTEEEFQALYGEWAALSPAEAVPLLARLSWWVVGGWALELATGVSRPHDDLDVAVPRSDLPLVAERVSDSHLWRARDGGLKPLSRFEELPPAYEQLWVRRNAQSSWLFEVLL